MGKRRVFCAIPNCRRNLKEFESHYYPKSKKLSEQWLQRIKAAFPKFGTIGSRHTFVICSKHFPVASPQSGTKGFDLPSCFAPNPDLEYHDYFKTSKMGYAWSKSDVAKYERIFESSSGIFNMDGKMDDAYRCSIPNCRRYFQARGVIGKHRLPLEVTSRAQWIAKIKEMFPTMTRLDSIAICNSHFDPKFIRPDKGHSILVLNAPLEFFPANPALLQTDYDNIRPGKMEVGYDVMKADDVIVDQSVDYEVDCKFKFGNSEPQCIFLNTESAELKRRWENIKKTNGFEGDEQFLEFLLNLVQVSNITICQPEEISAPGVPNQNYDTKIKANDSEDNSSFQNGVSSDFIPIPDSGVKKDPQDEQLFQSGTYHNLVAAVHDMPTGLLLPVKEESKSVVRTSRGRMVKPIMRTQFHESSSESDEDEPPVPKKPKKSSKLPIASKKNAVIANSDDDYCPSDESKSSGYNDDTVERVIRSRPTKDERAITRIQICPMCSFETASKIKLDKLHVDSHITELLKPDGGCIMCTKQVENPHAHFREHVMEGFSCKVCELVFPSLGVFAGHDCAEKTESRKSILAVGGSRQVSPNLVAVFKGDLIGDGRLRSKYRCLLCDGRFVQLRNVERHFIKKHKEKVQKNYVCTACGNLYYYKHELEHHYLIKHDTGDWKCGSCDKVMDSKLYYEHMRVHRQKYKVVCDVCGKKISCKTKLREHKLIHTNTKAFSCEFCDKKFVQKINRDQHQRLHTGERLYQCRFCKESFVQSSNYVQHLRKHTKTRARNGIGA